MDVPILKGNVLVCEVDSSGVLCVVSFKLRPLRWGGVWGIEVIDRGRVLFPLGCLHVLV